MKFEISNRRWSAAALICATLGLPLAMAHASGQTSASSSARVSADKNVSGASGGASTGTSGAGPAGSNVDNSAVNKRDRKNSEVTADQQSSGTTDTEITRQIRRALIADKELSVYAHNIKIITIGGVVTLKGPVKSADEQKKAVSFARSVAGVSKVDDQISIKQ